MKDNLLDKKVLAMYDVRGIQNYIFRSNLAKEIIGASAIVDSIIINGLEEYKKTKIEIEKRNYYLTDWKMIMQMNSLIIVMWICR